MENKLMRFLLMMPVLAVFAPVSLLMIGSFGKASATPATTDNQTSLSSPTCRDLTNVKEPVIVFGFEGSHDYSIEIDSQGQITAYAPKSPGVLPPLPPPIPLDFGFERESISPASVSGLVRLATEGAFWELPEIVGENKDLDSNSLRRFVTINLPCAEKQVIVPEGSEAPQVRQFAEMFMLLTDLVYNEAAGYKPLQ